MEPLIIDSFAGGGGASTGIEMALGRSPDIAINHNPAALALHEANHPETLHISENVYKVDPLDHLRRKHIGLAWFSPDCKHFSKAKGGKPVERNIRDLAWIIPGWIERIQKSGGKVDVVILENVEEFRKYGPLIETERGLMPDPEREGETFEKWCKTLRRLGGRLQWRELRACDYGAPTIRKRLFIVIRFDGQKIVWPERTHGDPNKPADLKLIKAGKLLPYRTAAEIIDWSLPCPSIFDTSAEIMEKHSLRAVRPLAAATMSRVARGTKRYVLDAARPFLVDAAHGEVSPSGVKRWGKGFRSVDDPLSVVTAGGINHAVISPSVIRFNTGATGHDAREPLATVTANSLHQSARWSRTARCRRANANAVIVPSLVGCGGRAGQSRPRGGNEPAATITAKADVCVTAAFLAQHNNDSRRDGGVNPGRSADEPVSTITANPQQGVVAAFVSRQFGTSTGHGMDEPTHTATANVNKSMLVAPHLMTMRNAGKPFNGADEPAHTVTAGGAGLSLVAPFMQKYYGTGDGACVDAPAHTVTVKDRFGFVEGELRPELLTEAQIARAHQVADFMREHGFWDEREFVKVDIAQGDQLVTFIIVDIGMRMLTPRELFSAQGFPADYIIDLDFNGRPLPKSVQISCCGNSVSPPVAAALGDANCRHLARHREAAE